MLCSTPVRHEACHRIDNSIHIVLHLRNRQNEHTNPNRQRRSNTATCKGSIEKNRSTDVHKPELLERKLRVRRKSNTNDVGTTPNSSSATQRTLSLEQATCNARDCRMGSSTCDLGIDEIPKTLRWTNIIRKKMAKNLRKSTLHLWRNCDVRRTIESITKTCRTIYVWHLGRTMHNDECTLGYRWKTTTSNKNSATISRRTRTMGRSDNEPIQRVYKYTNFDPRRAVEEARNTA